MTDDLRWWRDDPPIDKDRLTRAAYHAWATGDQSTAFRRIVDAVLADLVAQGMVIVPADDSDPAGGVS